MVVFQESLWFVFNSLIIVTKNVINKNIISNIDTVRFVKHIQKHYILLVRNTLKYK